MLLATGKFNGKMLRNEIIDVEEVMETFGIKINPDLLAEFKLLDQPGVIAVNLADGQQRYAHQRRILPVAKGSYKGSVYTIRYFTSEIQKENKGVAVTEYLPKKINWKGLLMTVDPMENLELAVLLMLKQQCAQSPFKGNREYEFLDRLAESQSRLEKEQAYNGVMSRIFAADGMKVLIIAKGIKIDQKVIPYSALATHSSLEIQINNARVELATLGRQHPQEVLQAFDDFNTQVRGYVKHAVDTNAVKLQQVAGGHSVWHWPDDTEIAKVRPDQDSMQVLEAYAFKNYSDFSQRLGEAMGVKVAKKAANNDVDLQEEQPAYELAVKAFGEGKLVLEEDNKVYLIVAGTREKNPLFIPKNPDNWLQETRNFNDIQIKRIQKALK